MSAETNPTETIAAWVAGTRPISEPQALALARQAVADTLAAMLAGSGDAVAANVRSAASRWGSGGCTVVGAGTAAAPVAALANATAGHALDYDDIVFPARAHASVVLTAALMALAEERGLSGAAVLDAHVVGFELIARLGEAMNLTHYAKGWHATATLALVGATAGTARLLGLDKAGVTNALGLAVSMAAGSKRQFGTQAKPLHAGLAAQNALLAASLAEAGVGAHPEMLEGKWSFRDLYAGPDSPGFAAPLAKLGNPLAILEFGLGLKAYPCCGSVHRSLDGLLELREKHDIDWTKVESVRTVVPPSNYQNLMYPDPQNEMQMRFSMQYGLATGLVDGAVRLRHFKPEMKDRPEVQDLLPRIVMEAYEDAVVSADLAKQNPALVQVTMADGRVLETRVQFPSGSSQKPMSEADTDAKFRDCATGVLSPATLDRAAGMLSGFGTLARAGDLMALFRADSAKAAAAE